MNITISSTIFAAAALFRGIEDIRYYLNGLYLETDANGARLVGCDGHQLAVAKTEETTIPSVTFYLEAMRINALSKNSEIAYFFTTGRA